MQNVSEKYTFVPNFLKFCGLYYEPFKVKSKRCEKLMQMWSIYMFRFHLMCVLVTVVVSNYSLELVQTDMNIEYCLILTMNSLFALALICLMFVYKNRKQNKKFWRGITEADEFLIRFLKIKIDYKTESRILARKFLRYAGTNFGIFALSYFRLVTSQGEHKIYKAFYPYFMLMARLVTAKYVFFVGILCNRLKNLVDNYERLKDVDYNILVIMRVYSIIWKLTRKIELMFNCTMVALLFSIVIMKYSFSTLFSVELEEEGFRLVYLGTASIIINIGYVCVNCYKVRNTVSSEISQNPIP